MSSDATTPPLHLVELHGGRLDRHDGHDRWWVTGPDAAVEDAAARAGLVETRRVHQMRVALPLQPTPPIMQTRAFDPGRDTEAWLAVNNAAFEWHPDQGRWTTAELEARMAEPWFDREGFRIAEIDGAMAGFCWTKVHADEEPALGEIFVVAVDPAHQGAGLGAALTVAGLDWLWRERRTPIGMLYVEADNHRALSTYVRIGFEIHSTDAAFEPATERTARSDRPAPAS